MISVRANKPTATKTYITKSEKKTNAELKITLLIMDNTMPAKIEKYIINLNTITFRQAEKVTA